VVGAAGMIGAAIVAKSPPDGYTLMVYSQTFINNMHLYQKVPFTLEDFAAVAMLTRFVGMLAVHPSMITPIAELYGHLQARRVRPIAVTSEKRTTQFPDMRSSPGTSGPSAKG
jgi:tripartite-type tricarboxylate transporter receptor subunit TctC